MQREPHNLRLCLHVTPADRVEKILREGLVPALGALSAQIETAPGIWMFPSWEAMTDAGWLFDEAWPHESEPALLAVAVDDLVLELEVDYEVVSRSPIEASRLMVLAPGENEWSQARGVFARLGGELTTAALGQAPDEWKVICNDRSV